MLWSLLVGLLSCYTYVEQTLLMPSNEMYDRTDYIQYQINSYITIIGILHQSYVIHGYTWLYMYIVIHCYTCCLLYIVIHCYACYTLLCMLYIVMHVIHCYACYTLYIEDLENFECACWQYATKYTWVKVLFDYELQNQIHLNASIQDFTH